MTTTTMAYARGPDAPAPFESGPLSYENRDVEDIHRRLAGVQDADAGRLEEAARFLALLEDHLSSLSAASPLDLDEGKHARRPLVDGDEETSLEEEEDDADWPSWERLAMTVVKRHKLTRIPHKWECLKVYRRSGRTSKRLFRLLVTKRSKSDSGIVSITVLSAPTFEVESLANEDRGATKVRKVFSCKNDCFYCPDQPGQPRSYLRDEPAVLRANQNGFDPVLQFFDRAATLYEMGQEIDKIELLILGGTWSAYPIEYRESFVRDLFFAANTFFSDEARGATTPLGAYANGGRGGREKMSLKDEIRVNSRLETCRIIGLTIETRPDAVTDEELRHFRRIGCTRVQLGIQHLDDEILRGVNRGCGYRDAREAIARLKASCFKVDAHYMPNLPNSSPTRDRAMLERAGRGDPDVAVDQMKIYPCEVVPFTRIEKWHKEGRYVPYDEGELVEVLIGFKAHVVPPWIRLNRVVRDIPTTYSAASQAPILDTKFRTVVQAEMARRGLRCRCIRCREIGSSERGSRKGKSKRDGKDEEEDAKVSVVVRAYEASGGTEFFISAEDVERDVIYGFCRLRLPKVNCEEARRRDPDFSQRPRTGVGVGEFISPFRELEGCALIRELHVYGSLVSGPQERQRKRGAGVRAIWREPAQHTGIGSRLLAEAESVAIAEGFAATAVIAGVGAMRYYEKRGYRESENFMVKSLNRVGERSWERMKVASVAVVVVVAYCVCYYYCHHIACI